MSAAAKRNPGVEGKRKLDVNLSKRKSFTLNEIEEYYGVAAETVRKWTEREQSRDGKPPLKAYKPGKDVIVMKDDFENYMKMFPL